MMDSYIRGFTTEKGIQQIPCIIKRGVKHLEQSQMMSLTLREKKKEYHMLDPLISRIDNYYQISLIKYLGSLFSTTY
jgi:hypothetical protein